MSKIRSQILKQLQKKSLSRYQLARLVEGQMSVNLVYKYLAGKCRLSETNLDALLKALALTIAPKPRRRRKKGGN